jgi:hypothetical protein
MWPVDAKVIHRYDRVIHRASNSGSLRHHNHDGVDKNENVF